ncbi:DUF2637 domain-containing protein [Streptomyces lunaelactis]|uniref:DUF2637 domain-containing protein n=1 Tax=Streptomyces lunaelactis TaxID=1535768 RepID=UPI001584D088|nr:DUF2637 domain-containing protein [Streptomyces lunaelactis]NUK70672.1 DUF2637 domain-containing protein [Streptomyces lunaelactis]NUK79350.1 DUF2637 domain-containing protein [Streptomyces lunaelactis]
MRHSLRIDAVLVQAVIAGALSFAHLHDLAAAAGQTGWKAWAYPVSVDLLLVAAWSRLRNDGPSQLAWCWFLVALVASLGANVATAGLLDLAHPPAWLRVGIAGWPALAFLGGTLLAHSPAKPDPEPVDDLPAEPAATHEPATAAVETPESAPALPPVTPVAVSAPAPLVAHARKVADAHRAATGNPIDTDTLRARLGVPAPMAEAIAAQLT